LEFNGKTLKYSWQETDKDGKRSVNNKEYNAISGRPTEFKDKNGNIMFSFDYSKERQKVKSTGPIPEGLYSITTDDFQRRQDKSSLYQFLFYHGFPKTFSDESWGPYRWGVKPEQAETYGRDGFTIHGGWEWGSAGCIDLTGGIDDFTKLFLRNFSNHQKTYLNVSYQENLVVKIKPINK
jgi:hypothetical protein